MFTMYFTTLLALSAGLYSATGAPNVKLQLLYESLCPYSRAFILDQLVPTYAVLNTILDVDLVGFGVAAKANWTKVTNPDGTYDLTFQCQHGPQECIGNEIHACVVESEPIGRALTLFGCMYNSTNYKLPATAAKECSTKLGFNYTAIDECASGPLGRGLHLRNGERFHAANPVAKTVPHIVLNGVFTQAQNERAEKDLFGLVCDIYTGKRPEQCPVSM